MFDPEEIKNLQTEGSMDTSYTPVPEGEWPAYVKDVSARSGEKDGNPWLAMDVTWAVTDPSVAEELGMEEPSVRQTIFLDMDSNGSLAMGKGRNIQLGRLREAVGQNDPGPWSPGQLEGASAVVRVSHREYEGRIFADVKGVIAA